MWFNKFTFEIRNINTDFRRNTITNRIYIIPIIISNGILNLTKNLEYTLINLNLILQ